MMKYEGTPGEVGVRGVGMMGAVGILNVGAGDTKLSFDKSNPAERIRAARIVKDMIRRGYSLLIEIELNGEKVFTRALDFDENVCEYVIADFDPLIAQEADRTEETHEEGQEGAREAQPRAAPSSAPGGKRKGAVKRVPAESARAVAVGKTAGG